MHFCIYHTMLLAKTAFYQKKGEPVWRPNLRVGRLPAYIILFTPSWVYPDGLPLTTHCQEAILST